MMQSENVCSPVKFDAASAPLAGRWLVEASAGTGKTYALERLVLRLVIEEGLQIERILVVTFTNAATAELRERVRSLFHKAEAAWKAGAQQTEFEAFFARAAQKGVDPGKSLQAALEHFDEASILTIHGFCQKMLSEFIFTRGGSYDVEFAADTGFEEKVVDEFLRRELPGLNDNERVEVLKWDSLAALLKKLCERGASVRPVPLEEDGEEIDDALKGLFKRFLMQAPERVRQLERLTGVKSFSSLLTEMYDLVKDNKEAAERIRSRYDAVLIDEFQDTDRVQYQIFKSLFLEKKPSSPKAVFFVGDPKQAIYAFRGAELSVYLRARSDIAAMTDAGSGLGTLDTNYRSTPALVGAVNAFFSTDEENGSFLTDKIRYQDLQAGAAAKPLVRITDGCAQIVPVMSVWYDDGSLEGCARDEIRRREAEFIANDIASLLDGTVYLYRDKHWRKIRPGDIAVLVKARADAGFLQEELLARGVRTLIDDRSSVFATEEAREIRTVFESMLAPTDTRLFYAARATRLIGRTLRELREDLASAGEDRELMKKAAERFEASGPASAIAFLAARRRLQERLLPVQGGAARLVNYEHLSELLQQEHRRLGSPASVVHAMKRLMAEWPVPDSHFIRQPNDDNAVRVVTIHSSKGLEYPVVYLVETSKLKPGKNNGKAFWIPDEADAEKVDVSPKESTQASDRLTGLDSQELLRQAYVAMTRASSRLVVPFSIAATRKDYARTDVNNAYMQALTGKIEPAQAVGDGGYKECLALIKNAVEGARERFARAVRETPALIDVGELNRTLAEDLGGAVKQPVPAASWQAFFEVCQEARPARHADLSTKTAVEALAPVAVPAAWHRSSFTSIARSLGAVESEEFEAEEFEGDEGVVETNEEAAAQLPQAHAGALAAAAAPAADEVRLQAAMMLRGAAAGDWIHKLFERVMNAPAARREELLAGIEPALAASGLLRQAGVEDRDDLLKAGAGLIADYVHNTLCCELFNAATLSAASVGEKPFVLKDLSQRSKICEMPFLLSAASKTLRAADVAQCLTRAGFEMTSLQDGVLKGYLTGAIDMLFYAGGKYFILDWKSNWLGAEAGDYTQQAMQEEIRRKHYALQYVIYLLALKRHLIATGVRSEEDVWDAIGGALYVFIRGTDADAPLDDEGRRTGVYFDRPREAVDALDKLLKGVEDV